MSWSKLRSMLRAYRAPAPPSAVPPSALAESDLVNFLATEEWRHNRNVRDGYARGWGLQFGELKVKVAADPLYRAAFEAARGRTVVAEENRMNIYLLMRFYLARLNAGHIVEFGSFKGGNAIFMAHVARELHPGMQIYALDTFAGMPQTDKSIDAHSAGDFAGVDLDELVAYKEALGLDNLHLVRGLFEDTAPGVLARAGPIVLAHIDCDIYDAVRYSYEVVRERMVPGGYFVFDDGTVSSCLGATEAVEELLIHRDGLHSEQIYPHFVFRAGRAPQNSQDASGIT